MRILCLLLFVSLLCSCKNDKPNSILSRDALSKQIFKINTTKDTVIKTANGALLQIGKESFTRSGGEVELEVKEAYSIKDIIKAGLNTTSDGKPLSSGGMIYINAVDDKVEIAKPIKVSLPTDNYDVEMQLYKGEEKDGEINWTDPKPIVDSMPPYIQTGKAIFAANCATCHALDKQITGPAMRGITNRGPWNQKENLFAATRNFAKFYPLTNYTICLVNQFGQMMPSFPQLSDSALDAIYDYIKYEEIKNNWTYYTDACADSCKKYDSARLVLDKDKMERLKLIDDNGPMSEVFYHLNDTFRNTNGNPDVDNDQPSRDLVTMEDNKANYYKFSINAFGWYNLDMLLKERDDLEESTLTVQLQGEVKTHVDIYLAIPSVKLFTKAGLTNNADEFAFDTKDGKLPLPQNTKAYIFAMSESSDGIWFAYKEFTTGPSQNIPIELQPSTKEQVYKLFDSLKFPDVSVKIEDSKNATEIRKLDKQLNELENLAEKLKPKNCNCDCGAAKDSTTK